jgi:hypothetical protein
MIGTALHGTTIFTGSESFMVKEGEVLDIGD